MAKSVLSTKRRSVKTEPLSNEPEYRIVRKLISSLKPSPENLKLYAAIDPYDPEIIKLAESIKLEGLHEPISITEDGFVVSGHRRHAACKLNGQKQVPCRVLPFRRESMSTSDFIVLLRKHNLQRYKSVAEQVREAMIDVDPTEAHARLAVLRDASINKAEANQIPDLYIEGSKHRNAIGAQLADHVKYIKKIVFEDRKDYWPMSVRSVHYPLLNYNFYRNIRRKIKYKNDNGSYKATSDLITRLRLLGEIPWKAFDDVTRPFKAFSAFNDVREFVQQEVDQLFAGYWRDLLQTQPCHVEVVVEKNTVYSMALRVTKKYQIPTSSGRGFSSIDAIHDLYQRYLASDKERLVVIVLSDFDPEGEQIPLNLGRTLRDDFEVDSWAGELQIIKAGVTRDQIERYDLQPMAFAKETSSSRQWFVDRNNGDESVYELEALDPADMMRDLECCIKGVLDLDLFNAEAAREQDEAAYLESRRNAATEVLRGRADRVQLPLQDESVQPRGRLVPLWLHTLPKLRPRSLAICCTTHSNTTPWGCRFCGCPASRRLRPPAGKNTSTRPPTSHRSVGGSAITTAAISLSCSALCRAGWCAGTSTKPNLTILGNHLTKASH